jgi:hypothetical protein
MICGIEEREIQRSHPLDVIAVNFHSVAVREKVPMALGMEDETVPVGGLIRILASAVPYVSQHPMKRRTRYPVG